MGRALLDGNLVVLARAHRQLPQAVLAGELAQAPEVRPRRLGVTGRRRHRHQTANIRVELEERAERRRRDTRFRRLPREVHLDERRNLELGRRRLRVERMTELACCIHDLRLAALQMTDEMPPERIAVVGVLHLEVLRAVLPHDLDARVGEQLELVERQVLRGDDDSDAGADLLPQRYIALGDLLT